jgi:hypothetical protein
MSQRKYIRPSNVPWNAKSYDMRSSSSSTEKKQKGSTYKDTQNSLVQFAEAEHYESSDGEHTWSEDEEPELKHETIVASVKDMWQVLMSLVHGKQADKVNELMGELYSIVSKLEPTLGTFSISNQGTSSVTPTASKQPLDFKEVQTEMVSPAQSSSAQQELGSPTGLFKSYQKPTSGTEESGGTTMMDSET